jgi:hypothetical protein
MARKKGQTLAQEQDNGEVLDQHERDKWRNKFAVIIQATLDGTKETVAETTRRKEALALCAMARKMAPDAFDVFIVKTSRIRTEGD